MTSTPPAAAAAETQLEHGTLRTKDSSSTEVPLAQLNAAGAGNHDAGAPPAAAGPKEELDDSLVVWDGPGDPENPQNMPQWRKWMITWLLSFLNIWVTFSSTIFASAVTTTSHEYDVSRVVMTLAVSLTVLVRLLLHTVGRGLPRGMGWRDDLTS